jgi:hypothetical protein
MTKLEVAPEAESAAWPFDHGLVVPSEPQGGCFIDSRQLEVVYWAAESTPSSTPRLTGNHPQLRGHRMGETAKQPMRLDGRSVSSLSAAPESEKPENR